jgi:DNA-binding NarL/FixJ family response regulator
VAGVVTIGDSRPMTDASPDQPTSLPRVLVVDSDERIRGSLAGLLLIGKRCVVIGSAGHPAAALALVETDPPDIVVLDPRLPDLTDGRAFIGQLRDVAPAVRVVVMGLDLEHSLGVDVDAVIRKTFRPRELIEAICAVAQVARA